MLTEKEYYNIFSKVPRVCIDLVIKGKGKSVLMLKRRNAPYNGFYNLPGGRVLFNESIVDSIKRIAEREIGGIIDSFKMIGYMEFNRERVGKNKIHSISIVFLCKSSSFNKGMFITSSSKNIHSVHRKFLTEKKYL